MSLPSEGEVGECLEMETSVLQDTVWDVNPSDKLPKQQVYQDHECFRWAVLCKAKRPEFPLWLRTGLSSRTFCDDCTCNMVASGRMCPLSI